MQPRRSLRLMAGALVLAVPLLGSCGFDKATDRVYTPAAGVDNRDGDVDVLSAVIVSAQPGSGTFIASLSNNDATQEFTLTSVKGSGDWSDLTLAPADLSIKIPGRGFVNLADEDPITVTGDLTPGQVADVSLSFDSGDSVAMSVPVVYACNYYEGYDVSATGPSGSASATESPSAGEVPSSSSTPTSSSPSSASDSASDSVSTSASPSGSASAGASGGAQPYDCSAVGEG